MKIESKTIAISAGLCVASVGNAHAAGADAILIFPLGLVFIVGIFIAVIKNAAPSRKSVVGVVAASHIIFWFFVVFVAIRARGEFRFDSVDTIHVYVTYPIITSMYLFLTYNIVNKVKSDKRFSYAFLCFTAIAYIVVGLFMY
ncbi:MAG: hypothetical protein HKN34_04410 [Gammaproteobacteria bacterium]|nr:hypothetical protein [Gammaproteobacteria bacterium]